MIDTLTYFIYRMDVCVKVVLDQKEYDRLLEIEKKFNQLEGIKKSHQEGAGSAGSGLTSSCRCQEGAGEALPLSQIIAENTAAHAVERPMPGILPAITTNEDESTTTRQEMKTETNGKSPKRSKKEKKKTEQKTLTFSSLTEKEKEELGFPRFLYPWYYIGAP